MLKFLLIGIFFILAGNVNGQYQAFPKLESLCKEGHYEKCIEKAEVEIKENPKEIIPYVWQMRCFIAIDEMETHPLKKNALTKALNLALKIQKKDKAETLTEELKDDFKKISDKSILQLSDLPEDQYAKGMAIFDKLKIIDNSLNLEYHKYLFMKNHYDAYAFMTLKNLVIKHYSLFRKKQDPLENMETAYADLMSEYYNLSHPEYARDVYIKSVEVYKKGTLCKEQYIEHIFNIKASLGYYADDITLSGLMSECLAADSLFNEPLIKNTIHEIRKYTVINNIRKQPVGNKTVILSILAYLSPYSPANGDSAYTFFDFLMLANTEENLKIDRNKIYDYRIKTTMEIRKQKLPLESIKSNHQYFLAIKKYELDLEFLDNCKTAYPSLKVALQPLNAELEKLIIARISDPDYVENPELIDKYVKKTDNKVLKEKQYKLYYTKLSALLAANNFSGFAVNMVRALALYPGDPQFLALKKLWVINDYKANYLTTEYGYEKFFARLPDEAKCEAGIVNKKGQDIVLQKINYCRRLAGAPDSCVLDEELNKKCQQAALMMSANGALSHAPPKTWKCFTTEGASGAGASNLSLGHAFHDAIMGQMEDDGSGNTACGHRRWILNPKNTVFGHGSTLNATSIYAFGTSNPKLKRKIYFNEKQPLCWPSTDYFPVRLIPGRWSFSLNGVDFEKAKISVTENGKSLPVSVEPVSYGYGPNTIVWVIGAAIAANKIYTITISGVMPYASWGAADEEKPVSKTFTYKVIPIEIN